MGFSPSLAGFWSAFSWVLVRWGFVELSWSFGPVLKGFGWVFDGLWSGLRQFIFLFLAILVWKFRAFVCQQSGYLNKPTLVLIMDPYSKSLKRSWWNQVKAPTSFQFPTSKHITRILHSSFESLSRNFLKFWHGTLSVVLLPLSLTPPRHKKETASPGTPSPINRN